MTMAEIIINPPVLTPPYAAARDVLLFDKNLGPKEVLLLVDCLGMRQQDREFRQEMRERAVRENKTATDEENNFIDYCNNSWRPNAVLFRLTSGEDFADSRDMQARDRRIRLTNELTRQRNVDYRDHNAAVASEEKRMHDLLQGYGAQAKRLFNTIAISGMTSHHFGYDEFAAALRFPNPLERMLP